MEALTLQNLSKQYKGRTALEPLSLGIKEGEFFALLGQNGAGKTTAIKLLCGLAEPTGGDALVLGHSVTTQRQQAKQRIGVSPQETAVAAKLSVRENLELAARIYGASPGQAEQKARQKMEEFGLLERAGDKAKALSGGLQRKLSIAMALISEPSVLFLDEPTLGLDVRARRELWKQIEALKGRITVVLTTHYLEEAEALADRIAILNRGRLQVLGTPDEIVAAAGSNNFEEAFLKFTDEEAM